jgi:aromatic ring-opening dioxygenase catalytic subunit (LigB family)
MSGIIAAAVVAHVPTLSRAEITPDFQRTLVDGERALGEDLRGLKPDLWVIASAHWVSTFNWFATCQPEHKGLCVADEAPDLIPGLPYHYRGDPQFAGALVEEWQRRSIPAARNESPHYAWDYGTFVPLSHMDPKAEVAVVGLPVVLMADHAECIKAGAAIAATAQALGRRAVFVASTAFTHALVRGRHLMPTPARIDADQILIDRLKRGAIEELIVDFADYSRATAAEMGGRVLATLLGVMLEIKNTGAALQGRQYGQYAQSSGSGNANVLIADTDTLAAMH